MASPTREVPSPPPLSENPTGDSRNTGEGSQFGDTKIEASCETIWISNLGQDAKGLPLHDESICTVLVEAYGRLKQLERAESVVGTLRQRYKMLYQKVWNALLQAYAANGCYEKVRAAFNTMMRDSSSPTGDTMNSLLEALIVDGRLNELYVVIQDLQDMGR